MLPSIWHNLLDSPSNNGVEKTAYLNCLRFSSLRGTPLVVWGGGASIIWKKNCFFLGCNGKKMVDFVWQEKKIAWSDIL